MADYDHYSHDQRGYERGRQWNRADRRDRDDYGQPDDRDGYGASAGYGGSEGLYNDSSYGNYGGGGGDYDVPRYSRGREERAFGQPRGPRPSPRGGTYAYGAEDSARGYQRQYDPYLDRNAGYESRPFNPYAGEFGGDYERQGYGSGRDHHRRHGRAHQKRPLQHGRDDCAVP